MALGSVLLKMQAGQEDGLRSRLAKVPVVSIEQVTPGGELILLLETDNISALHKQCADIERWDGVLGVYPSYITTEDEIQT